MMRTKLSIMTATAVAAVALAWVPASALDDPTGLTTNLVARLDPQAATSSSCAGGLALYLTADPAEVRRLGHVPARWKLRLDERGKARLFVDGVKCTIRWSGGSHTVTYSEVAALLDEVPSPESNRETSDVAGVPLNLYLISWTSNDRGWIDWLKQGTGYGNEVRYVSGLDWNFAPLRNLNVQPSLTSDLRFNAPAPEPSPYSILAEVTESGFPVHPSTLNAWRETPLGTTMIESSHLDPNRFGLMTEWQITTDPHSALGRMIGGGTQKSVCTPAVLLSPIPALIKGEAEPGCLGSDTFLSATWRKDIP